MSDETLQKRLDGRYQENLDSEWLAEYFEDPDTGLWSAAVYRRDVTEWQSHGYGALEEARHAAKEFYDRW